MHSLDGAIMLLKQQFKTLEGVQKRAAFENAHCANRYRFTAVRCRDGEKDLHEFNRDDCARYTWRIEKQVRR